jgi:hypothetical protein
MAAVLATCDDLQIADEPACILALVEARYQAGEIAAHLDEARHMAFDIRIAMIEADAERLRDLV